MVLPFTLKSILKKKKNYENSNISPRKNIIFKKNPLKETKIFQDIINSIITNLNFQHKPKYHLPKILILKKKKDLLLLPSWGQNPLYKLL
jgi:hypothetical protein